MCLEIVCWAYEVELALVGGYDMLLGWWYKHNVVICIPGLSLDQSFNNYDDSFWVWDTMVEEPISSTDSYLHIQCFGHICVRRYG